MLSILRAVEAYPHSDAIALTFAAVIFLSMLAGFAFVQVANNRRPA